MRDLLLIVMPITFLLTGCVPTPAPPQNNFEIGLAHLKQERFEAAYRLLDTPPPEKEAATAAIMKEYPKLIQAGSETFTYKAFINTVATHGREKQ